MAAKRSLPEGIFSLREKSKEAIMNLQAHNEKMKELIWAAKMTDGKNVAVVCPTTHVMYAINEAIKEKIINKAFLIGDTAMLDSTALRYSEHYTLVHIDSHHDTYFQECAGLGVEEVKRGNCDLLMKGNINTATFLRAVVHHKEGLSLERRLSVTAIFSLPRIKRLIFLTDPAINTGLSSENNYKVSIDIIKNAIDIARSMGNMNPKVALLEANEIPTERLPVSIIEKELSEMPWVNAMVSGPLSYDLALYEESVRLKGLKDNPVAGKADILVVPYLAAGNILYKAWAITMRGETATIVAGAKVPIILTSRSDTQATKFLSLCAAVMYSNYQLNNR